MQQLRFVNPSSNSRGRGPGDMSVEIQPFLVQFGRPPESGGASWVTYARDFPHRLALDEHRQAKVGGWLEPCPKKKV